MTSVRVVIGTILGESDIDVAEVTQAFSSLGVASKSLVDKPGKIPLETSLFDE